MRLSIVAKHRSLSINASQNTGALTAAGHNDSGMMLFNTLCISANEARSGFRASLLYLTYWRVRRPVQASTTNENTVSLISVVRAGAIRVDIRRSTLSHTSQRNTLAQSEYQVTRCAL